MKRRLVKLFAAAIIFAVVISLAPVLDKLVLFPSRHAIDAGGATRKTVALEQGELEAWTARSRRAVTNNGPDSYVLRFYGNADRPERWVAAEAEMFPERAVEVWGVNYPGFGGSTGPARLAQIGPAALEAFDAMQREAAGRPIIVSGTSFGTIAALHIAARRPVTGLVLHNPPAVKEMILRDHGWWNLWLLAAPLSRKVPAEIDSVANARLARAPAVFLLAENDMVVRPKFQQLVVEAYAGEKRVISLAGAGHNSPLSADATAQLKKGFLWMLAKTAPGSNAETPRSGPRQR